MSLISTQVQNIMIVVGWNAWCRSSVEERALATDTVARFAEERGLWIGDSPAPRRMKMVGKRVCVWILEPLDKF